MLLITPTALGGIRKPLRRREHDEGCANGHEKRHTDQFSTCNHVAPCLKTHNSSVCKAGPCGECDQPATRKRVADCQKQEDPERDVKAEHHGQGGLLSHHHHQGINQGQKEHSDQRQHDLQSQNSIHICPPEYCATLLFFDSDGVCEVDQFDREYSPALKLKSKYN